MAREPRSTWSPYTTVDSSILTASSLDIGDLMRLFGNIQEDAEGKPFIMVDNPDAAGGFFADQDHEGYADEF